MVGNNLNSSKSDVEGHIAAANILLNMGFYRRALVQVHLALNILKKQGNIHDFMEFSLEFAQKLLDLYKIYWADEICLHIITICDDIFKISNPVLKTSKSHILITQNRTAVKIKFDTLVLLIKIYKENQHNDAIALTKVLAKLMREQNKLLYSFTRDSLTLSFVPSYPNFPLVDIFEEYIANGASSFENKSLPLFHFHSLNVFLGILYSLQKNYSLADQYYIQAIWKLAEYAQLLQLNKKLTVETLTIIKKIDEKLKQRVEKLRRENLTRIIAKAMSTSNPRDETTTEELHQITFTPEPSSKYPVEYLMGARTLAHFILVLKEHPPVNKLAYEDFMRFTFLPMLMCLEEDIPKNLCAVDRTRVAKERIPLLEQLAALLPLYIDRNEDVLRGFIAKQIEAFKTATDDTEHNKFFDELPPDKPKPRVPIIPRQPRNRSTPKVDVTDKPPEKTKIDIATIKTALESSIVLDTFLDKIKDSYRDFYPKSTIAVIQIESMQILSRAVYEFIYEQYARIDWNNWASTLKTLYIHVELQKQIVDCLKLTQTCISTISNEQLKNSTELPKEKSEMLTEFSRVLHEWEESLNITKNNISHMKNLLAENKQLLQERHLWEKETKERSEVSKEAHKIPTTQETLETTHQTLKKIHADLYDGAPPVIHKAPICSNT